MLAILLVAGNDIDAEKLRTLSLQNTLQLVIGDAYGFGFLLHLNATTVEDLNRAISDFAQVENVSAVTVLALRSQ
jgi:hypothetical protein